MIFASLFTQCFLQLGIVTYYELNKNYIAHNLCENRDKPQLKCCGKCYLHKQLKKADATDNPQNIPDKFSKAEAAAYILPQSWNSIAYSVPANIPVKNPAAQHLHGISFYSPVFHPPATIV